MLYSQWSPFSRTLSARMVRPFFRWMVSALAQVAPSSIDTIKRIVTRALIEAHSINGGLAHPCDESTNNNAPWNYARDLPGNLHPASLWRCAPVHAPGKIGDGGGALPAAQPYASRSCPRLSSPWCVFGSGGDSHHARRRHHCSYARCPWPDHRRLF